ncbi:hypothetical protein V8C86DRAFT_2624938 [Haematococcus lacustris]
MAPVFLRTRAQRAISIAMGALLLVGLGPLIAGLALRSKDSKKSVPLSCSFRWEVACGPVADGNTWYEQCVTSERPPCDIPNNKNVWQGLIIAGSLIMGVGLATGGLFACHDRWPDRESQAREDMEARPPNADPTRMQSSDPMVTHEGAGVWGQLEPAGPPPATGIPVFPDNFGVAGPSVRVPTAPLSPGWQPQQHKEGYEKEGYEK